MVFFHPCRDVRQAAWDPCSYRWIIWSKWEIELCVISIEMVGEAMCLYDGSQWCSVCGEEEESKNRSLGNPSDQFICFGWSLNAIDTIFSTRSLGSGEPVCPDGTFAAGYTMDAWERWRIVCLAALSVEDIEDIYLFGTMITGLLLIGLGFALGYRRIQKTGSFLAPLPALASAKVAAGKSPLGRALQWDALAFLPHCTDTDYKLLHTHTHKDMHSPPHPRSLASVALNRQPDKNSGCGTGWLLAGAGLLPLLDSRVFMVYVLLCWGVFPVLTLYSPRSIVWGLFFFSSPSSCYAVFFLPLYLHFTTDYTLYDCVCDE